MPDRTQAPALGGCVGGVSGLQVIESRRARPSGFSCKSGAAVLVEGNGHVASEILELPGNRSRTQPKRVKEKKHSGELLILPSDELLFSLHG